MAEVQEEIVNQTSNVTTPNQQVTRTTRSVVTEPQVNTGHPQNVYDTKKSIFRTYQIIWYILGFIEVLLTFRIVLKVLAANSSTGFVSLVYALSDPFALPFNGVLGVTTTPEGSLFEWSTLVAMAVYWIVAYGIVLLFQFFKPVTPQEVEEEVDTV